MNKYILNVCSITARIKVSRLLIRIYLVSTRKQIELEWNITGFSHKVLTWYFFTGLSNKIYVFPVNVVVIAESRQDRPKFVRFFSFSLYTQCQCHQFATEYFLLTVIDTLTDLNETSDEMYEKNSNEWYLMCIVIKNA